MQIRLNYCDSLACDNNVKYNTRKTLCTLIGSKIFKSDFLPYVELSGFELNFFFLATSILVLILQLILKITQVQYISVEVYIAEVI